MSIKPTFWARRDHLQQVARNGFCCAMYPETDGRSDQSLLILL